MENASKALIIAGAILLSILIISLGIMVYNNAKNSVGNADLSEQEVQAFNAKFTSYLGDNKKSTEVNSLIDLVVASNAANPSHKITMGYASKPNSSNPTEDYVNGNNIKYYNATNLKKISFVYDAKGYITHIQAVNM